MVITTFKALNKNAFGPCLTPIGIGDKKFKFHKMWNIMKPQNFLRFFKVVQSTQFAE